MANTSKLSQKSINSLIVEVATDHSLRAQATNDLKALVLERFALTQAQKKIIENTEPSYWAMLSKALASTGDGVFFKYQIQKGTLGPLVGPQEKVRIGGTCTNTTTFTYGPDGKILSSTTIEVCTGGCQID